VAGLSPAYLWPPADLTVEPPPLPEPTPPPRQVVWVGTNGNNYSRGRSGMTVIAVVVHTMAGSLSSCDSWFSNPSAQVSSQFGIGLLGQIHQYVSLGDTAWANGILEPGNTWPGAPYSVNAQTVSIETEDRGSGTMPVTEAEYQATLHAARMALEAYPSIVWLLGHHCISPNTRPNCCGDRWRASGQFDRLAGELGLQPRY
jgi:N-acetyl-anhydromuramyl-L-alanine amidase AmpD